MAESQDFDEFGGFGFLEYFNVAEFANVNLEFDAILGFFDLIRPNFGYRRKLSGVSFYLFPIFNQIDQTSLTLKYGSFKSIRAFWPRQSLVDFVDPRKDIYLKTDILRLYLLEHNFADEVVIVACMHGDIDCLKDWFASLCVSIRVFLRVS